MIREKLKMGMPPVSASFSDRVHINNLWRAHIYHGSAELAERPASMQAYP